MKKNFHSVLFRLFFVGMLANFHFSIFAQDSSRIRVSLLTCTPGDELYSIFGHSAIRVVDSSNVMYRGTDTAYSDIVYNYGTFNFDDEGFYIKFIRGKLNYYISTELFEDFKYLYQATNRGIIEQVLNLSPAEEVLMQRALNENLKEENKYYQYDFFFDNCTTRLRDLILSNKNPIPVLPAVRPQGMRFRQAIHEYLDKGKQYWSKLGIDLLLGAPTDRVMTASEQQFLPDNLMMALDRSTNTPVVNATKNLYLINDPGNNKSWFTPGIVFTSLLVLFVVLQFLIGTKRPLLLDSLDGLLFFLVGLIGLLLVFMWVATDHSMTKNNYNLLWALPTHLFVSFLVTSRKSWVKKYFGFTALAGVMLLVCWFFLPQQMNNAFIPIVLLLTFRAATRYYKTSTNDNQRNYL